MSDLAPLFTTDVAEVLRETPIFTTGVLEVLHDKTIDDYAKENAALKKENKTRKKKTLIEVSRVIRQEDPWTEEVVAEGYLEDMKTFNNESDIPEKYSSFIDDRPPYYVVELRNTAVCIGNVDDLSESAFIARLKQGKSRTTLGIYNAEGSCSLLNRHQGCLRSVLRLLESDLLTPATVELEQKTFCLDQLAFKIVSHDNDPYWDTYVLANYDFDRLEQQFLDNAPANSAKVVLENLFFRPVETSMELLQAVSLGR